MAIEQFNHIKDVLDELDNQRPARFGYTEAAVNATGAAEIAALEGLFIIEDPTQINSIPTPDLVGMDPIINNIGLRAQAATISRMAVNHFFGRLGLNLLKVTEKLKLLVDEHLVNRYITPSGNVLERITVTQDADEIILIQHRSPLSASSPVTASAPVTLSPAVYDGNAGVMTGADKKKLEDVDSTAVKVTGDQSIAGIKTFSSIPVLPATDPTSDNQAVRKAYVDSRSDAIIEISTDTVLSPNTKYIINANSVLTLTLPAVSEVGQSITIIDVTGFGFKIKPNTGQFIYHYNRKTVLGDSVNSFVKSATQLVCIVASSVWKTVQHAESFINQGYAMGGYNGAYYSTIENLNFLYETSSIIIATLDTARRYGVGVNSTTKGYHMGGTTPNVNIIEDMNFDTELSSVIAATLSTARAQGIGCSSGDKGYYMGGSGTNLIEALEFNNEVRALLSATLNVNRSQGTGVSSVSKGYCIGGFTSAWVNSIENIDFSNDTSEAITAVITTARGNAVGVQNLCKGYILGGSTSAAMTSIESLNFNNETTTVLLAVLDVAKSQSMGVCSHIKGYVMGGVSGGSTYYSAIEDITFSNEASYTISAALDVLKAQGCGVSGCL